MMSNYYNGYNRKDLIKFLKFQDDMPNLFLHKEEELNGEFWGDEDDDYCEESCSTRPIVFKQYNDNLKSDNW